MSSIRLYEHQIEKLQKCKSSGSDIIRFAIRRFLRGEFVTQNEVLNEKLKVYSLRKKDWTQSDEEVRAILDAHFNNPRNYTEEIEALDKTIEGLFNMYTKQPFILDESNNGNI